MYDCAESLTVAMGIPDRHISHVHNLEALSRPMLDHVMHSINFMKKILLYYLFQTVVLYEW